MEFNVWVFLVHIVCAVLIMACVAIWVWKPTNEFIAQQKKKLDKEKTDLVVNNRETRYFLGLLKKERYEVFYAKRAMMKAAAEEAERIRAKAKADGEMIAAEKQTQAEARIRAMERDAQEKIEKHLVDVAVGLASKLVDANVDAVKNKALIDAYIKELEGKQILEGDERKVF